MVKPYNCFQSQGRVKQNFNGHAYCLLSCRDNATLIFFICQVTVTLYQGQGNRNEHKHIDPRISLLSCQVLNAKTEYCPTY